MPETGQRQGEVTPGASWSISEQDTPIEGDRSSGSVPLLGALGSAVLALVEPEGDRDAVLATQTMTPLELVQLLRAAQSSNAAPLVATALVAAGAHPWPFLPIPREDAGMS